MRRQAPSHPDADNFLGIVLGGIIGAAFVGFLVFISLGFFLWVIAVAAGVFALGGVHYLLWGHLIGPRRPDVIEMDEASRLSEETFFDEGDGVRREWGPGSPRRNGSSDPAT